MIEYLGPPSEWIARHGCPADAVGSYHDGMPSYEHETEGWVVMENVYVAWAEGRTPIAFPNWYEVACVISRDDMVPLHHNPGALWEWRPMLYHLSLSQTWHMMGSQVELRWRYGFNNLKRVMAEIDVAVDTEGKHVLDEAERWIDAISLMIAERKASELLLEHLNPTQRLEYLAGSAFRTRGGGTGHIYEIQISQGFQRINPLTGQTLATYCWHTEHWIPAEDVALATMLQLSDPDLERDALESANQMSDYTDFPQDPPTAGQIHAADLERELIPA